MSIGYLLFMTEGLISAIMFRQLDGPERVRAIQSHALLQLRAVLCIAAGFLVIYRNKVKHATAPCRCSCTRRLCRAQQRHLALARGDTRRCSTTSSTSSPRTPR